MTNESIHPPSHQQRSAGQTSFDLPSLPQRKFSVLPSHVKSNLQMIKIHFVRIAIAACLLFSLTVASPVPTLTSASGPPRAGHPATRSHSCIERRGYGDVPQCSQHAKSYTMPKDCATADPTELFGHLRDKKVQGLVREQVNGWRAALDREAFDKNKKELDDKEVEWKKAGIKEDEIKVLRLGYEEIMMVRDGGSFGLAFRRYASRNKMQAEEKDCATVDPTELERKFGHLRDKNVQKLVREQVDEWRAAQDREAFDKNKKELDDKEVEWKKAGIKEDEIKVLRLGYEEMMMVKDGGLFGLAFRRYASRNNMMENPKRAQ
ncbi:hypothetical protein H0H93_012565 [Arthromyces matolae]|nr:hypothetical protein H0H93_012565 [Arthromyces matolae]